MKGVGKDRDSIESLERNYRYRDSDSDTDKNQIAIPIIITAVIVWLIGLSFQVAQECTDQACFDERLMKCQKTTFIAGNDEIVYEYSIEGRSGEFCAVNVKLLQGQLNEENSKFLEGKEMTCNVPFGTAIRPESDMKNCHGELKEGLQEIIIENLHAYIVGNLEKINEEINSG